LSTWTDHENGDTVKTVLVRGDDEALLVAFGSSSMSSLVCPFSADGSHLAWGNVDGTVTVCDIQRVRQRLAEVGLGW
jgi:hypothetical protein